MTPDGLDLSVAGSPEDIAACMALRWDVFVVEQHVPEADELDGLDDACVHVLARMRGNVVGAARYRVLRGVVKIQRVCVDKPIRGAGVGAALIQFICADSGARHARLSAQTDALAFYEGLGFSSTGEVYMDAGLPHQDMEKELG